LRPSDKQFIKQKITEIAARSEDWFHFEM